VRNPRILGIHYRSILKAHGAAHIYSHYTGQPSLLDQHVSLDELFTAPFVVLRLLTPRDTNYHDAVKAYRPYNKLVKPLRKMRQEAVSLIQLAMAARCRAYVLVNNRTEWNAPRTIQALADKLTKNVTP
jgi:hypothetical protein